MYLKVEIIGNGISVKCAFITETRQQDSPIHHAHEHRTSAKLRHHIILLLFTPIIRLIERGNGGGDSKRIDFDSDF